LEFSEVRFLLTEAVKTALDEEGVTLRAEQYLLFSLIKSRLVRDREFF
jgi:hypothetical protein